MLILSRKLRERVLLQTSDGDIWIELIEVTGRSQVRIGIDAPKSVVISREELLDDDREVDL